MSCVRLIPNATVPVIEPSTNAPVQIEPAEFVPPWTDAGHINVNINFGIVEQFSEGLYSSPNKTFEELVTNAYDAGAHRVWVHIPDKLNADGAIVSVIDDGESMDVAGLQNLWQIGQSTKRTRPSPLASRKPVGRFGIGKLATYVLANELTYVCKKGGEFLAATMDYRKVTGRLAEAGQVVLDVRQLTESDARATLMSAIGDGEPLESLFGPSAPSNWTAALMSSLKERGLRLEQGRVRWILSVALPLNPQFQLWFNGTPLASSKADGTKI